MTAKTAYVYTKHGTRVRANSYSAKSDSEKYAIVYGVFTGHTEKSPETWVHRATYLVVNGHDPSDYSPSFSLESKLHSLREEIDECLKVINKTRSIKLLRNDHGRTSAEIESFHAKADALEQSLGNWLDR